MTEPIAKTVTRWKCPHCPRSWASKRTGREHIARCWFNPANRACKTCTHFTPRTFGDGITESASPDRCAAGEDLTVVEPQWIGFDPIGCGPVEPEKSGNPWVTTLRTHCPKWTPDRVTETLLALQEAEL